MGIDNTYTISAGAPSFEGVGAGGGLGNRVNAAVLATVLRANEVAIKSAMQLAASDGGVGRILNVTV